MAYQVLARKWRPKSFSSLKGQEHVTRALINALERNQLHHAYLFTGTRGVGKTTLARLLAKCLNCHQGVSAHPCNACAACVQIDAGCFVDLIEVDAASRTRVEDTRELLDNVQYAPSLGRFKIYLIDEVHMLSGHSFNALLKTLEEPPAHVKFILATTDPERIPVTVLSRCLRLSLKALSVTDITKQLSEILSAENIAFEENALPAIAQAAAGSMRDALSLLEQAIAYCDGTMTLLQVEAMLGLSYQRYLAPLLLAIGAQDAQQSLHFVDKMAEVNADFSQVLASILQRLHTLAVAQMVPEVQTSDPTLIDTLTPEAIQLLYQIALLGQKDIAFAPSARVGFEMTLLRMIAFCPVSTTQSTPPPGVKKLPENVSGAVVKVSSPEPASVPASVPIAAPSTEPTTLDWAQVIPQLSLSGLGLMIVKHCAISHWDGKMLALTLDTEQKACLNAQRQTQIHEALNAYFKRPIQLKITVGDTGLAPTPMAQAQTARQAQEKQAVSYVEQNKVVQSIISTFDAKIEKVSLPEK